MKQRITNRTRSSAWLAGLACAFLLGLPLAGCVEKKGPLEKIGEELDDAADKVGDAVEDVADEVEDAVDEDG